MNFDFSEDQKFLKDQARKFLSETCPATVARAVLEAGSTHDAGLWTSIAQMGWTGTAIPEAYGGLGLGHLELCVIAEELGRALAPVPFASSVYLATEAVLTAGSEAQKQAYLPRLADGSLIGTLAMAEGPRPATPASMAVSFDGAVVTGDKLPVPDGMVADFAIVVAKNSGGTDEADVDLALVDLNGPGVSRETVSTLDPTRPHAVIRFDGAPAERLGTEGAGWTLVRQVLDRAAVLTAFEQVGGADACLEMAKDWALNRYAFGRQIGSFQAIKHKLADMYINTELARSNAYFGAWALSTDSPDLAIAAAGARVSATQAYHYASKENIQTHGGMGFTWEGDCHLHYRRSKHLSLVLGAERVWKDRLVNQLERRNVA
ncbi:MAG: acyl-CoA dehydrogenase family protein [Alphaproteobacteria bacterium]